MNILVLGGTGFIGTNLLLRLKNNNTYKIYSTYYLSKPRIHNKNIIHLKANLTSKRSVLKVFKKDYFDVVVMCAAVSTGAKDIKNNPLIHLNDNIIMNLNTLEYAKIFKVKKFIFISSNTVYPLTKYPVKETDAKFDFYKSYYVVGWMKRFTEIVCDIYSTKIPQDNLATIILRPANLYGPYDKFDPLKSKVIPSLIRKVYFANKTLNIWGDGKDIKDFLFIDDFIDGLLKVVKNKKINSGIFNISSNRKTSIKAIIPIILNVQKKKLKIEYDLDAPKMIPYRMISNSKFTKIFKWKPKTSLKKGLLKTIIWYSKNVI